MKTIEFDYQKEKVYFTFQRAGQRNGFPNNPATVVSCQHPVFISAFGSPTVHQDSLMAIVDEGRYRNREFFEGLLSGFMSYRP